MKVTHEYGVELIYEPTGTVMYFDVETDEEVDEVELSRIIWGEMSVIVMSHEEIEVEDDEDD